MKTRFLSIAIIFLSGVAVTVEAAGIIGVNCTPEASAMVPEDLAGAPGVRTGNWNNAFTEGSNTVFDLFDGSIYDSEGVIVNGLSISIFTGNGGSTTQRGNPPGGTAPALINDGRMFRTVIDKFEGTEGSFTVTGIPFPKYHLYFYVYPDSGGGGERGGYFTVTNSAGLAQTRWLKGGTGANTTIPLPNPDTGDGYLQSKTATPPMSFAEIDTGHFVVLSDLIEPDVVIYFSAVGAGAGGVAGGDGVRRLKFSGFQIVEVTSATLTGLSLASPIPALYSGNPQAFPVPLVGNYSDGSTAPLTTASGIAYASSNTNVFTVTGDGQIQPRAVGTADLQVTYQGQPLTQQVSVVGPVAIRPVLQVDPLYLGARNLPIRLLADFADGQVDVDVSRFAGLSFSGGPPSVVTVSSNGLLTTVGEGVFNLSASYAGVTGITEAAGTVLPYDPPQPDGSRTALSFNIQSGQAMAFNDLAGAPGVRVGSWNNIAGLTGSRNTVTLLPGSVLNSAGQPVNGLEVNVTGGSSTAAGVSTRGTQSGNETTMFYGIYDQFNGTPGTIHITGLPFASYDVYFYVVSGDADNRPGHFTIGDQTRWILDSTFVTIPDTDGGGYVEAVTTNAPQSVAEVQPGNYVMFPNLTGSTLDVEFAADGADVVVDADASAPRLKFSGFQIVGDLASKLQISRADANQLRIAWPAPATGFVLKSNTVLDGTWNPVNATPVPSGGELSVTVPVSGVAAYYVLQKP